MAATNNYDDTGVYNENNISQHSLCTSKYIHVNPHSYIVCIPHVEYSTTKMDVARAVENQILNSGNGKMSEIENFKYVQNVTFVRAFDQVTCDNIMNTNAAATRSTSSSSSGSASSSYYDPWYKIAMVNVVICPGYDEYAVEFYTTGEDAFYSGICRGDIVINSWRDAFFVVHPRTYFQPQPAQQTSAQKKSDKKEVCEYQNSAFQKWNYEFELKKLERKVKQHENTIRQYELDAIRHQNVINEYAESMRFLTRKTLDSPELYGLTCSSNQMTSYISALNNRYARVCISDTTFLEANRNMKLKQMNGHVINACDDCDACQELIHSIDHTSVEYREELFYEIEKMVCKINRSVQRFEKLHVNAERSLFGLRNRRVLEDFGAYLNTALQIVEEVTSRVSVFTQDLEYARCYGQLYRNSPQNYYYDYAEDADEVYENENENTGIDSTQNMLQYFDDHHQELYKEQEEQEQQKEQEEQKEQEQQKEQKEQEQLAFIGAGVYHEEEAVIIESSQEDKVKSDTVVTAAAITGATQETHQKKRGSWLPSWFSSSRV
jgi:hypothetical protein